MATQVSARFGDHPYLGWLAMGRHVELITSLAYRDLEGRYRGSYLGALWSYVNPLFTLLLYTFVFSVVMKVKVNGGGPGGFAFYLMCGLLPWMALSEAWTRATTVIVGSSNLVKKVVFPLETLTVSVVASAVFNQLIATGLLVIAVAFFGGGLKLSLVWYPVILLMQLALSLGIGWMLASLGVFVRDISQAIGLILNFGMYLTPIVYPESMVPAQFRWLLLLNPIAFLVKGYRGAILDGSSPEVLPLLANMAFALLILILGYAWFAKTKRAFADVL